MEPLWKEILKVIGVLSLIFLGIIIIIFAAIGMALFTEKVFYQEKPVKFTDCTCNCNCPEPDKE